jgi:ERCC4-type nuclease
LDAGDYICGAGTVVERKSIADLHGSISDGGFWPQMGRIRDAGKSPFLLLEGPDLYRGPVDAAAIRGVCFAVSDLGVGVIHSAGPQDSARWLMSLVQRRQNGLVRDRPAYAQRRKRTRQAHPAEAALAAIPNISVVSARSLLECFGSLRSVVLGDVEAWQRVAGIGSTRAAALDQAINSRWSPPQPD